MNAHRLLEAFAIIVLSVSRFCAPAAAQTAGVASEPEILSEIRIGALYHDAGVFVTRQERAGIDANAEFLFVSPEFLEIVWSPRPHLGVTVNPKGVTSQAYFGLTWDVNLFAGLFFEVGLGGAIHDGELTTKDPDRKKLGCRWLYRESVSLGYRFAGRHSVSALLDHISNNGRCDRNAGMDMLGMRWGYKF
jgi:lipid A 3-O-deacylase